MDGTLVDLKLDNFRRPKFGMDPSFEMEIEEMRKKWLLTPYEPYMRYMIDALVIFRHHTKHTNDNPMIVLDNYLEKIRTEEKEVPLGPR